MEQATKELVLSLCKVLDDKKAVDIKALYVADKTIVAEWFVVCSGRSSVQVKTLCDELEDKAASLGLDLLRKEGYNEGRWIVLDFGVTILPSLVMKMKLAPPVSSTCVLVAASRYMFSANPFLWA